MLLLKRGLLLKKNAFFGSKFFPFKVNPFSERRQNTVTSVAFFECVSIFLDILKPHQEKPYLTTCAASQDSDRPVYQCSPTRVFGRRSEDTRYPELHMLTGRL